MIGKVCCALAMTYQIKKSYIHDIAEDLCETILPIEVIALEPQDEDIINHSQFVEKMQSKLAQFDGRFLENIEDRVDSFCSQIRQDHLPNHLRVG